MTKFLSAIALFAAVATPAIVVAKEAPGTHRFTRDGQTYVYTATTKGAATILSGRSYPSGRTFLLTVRGKRVSGHSGGVPVAFVADGVPVIAPTEIAAR